MEFTGHKVENRKYYNNDKTNSSFVISMTENTLVTIFMSCVVILIKGEGGGHICIFSPRPPQIPGPPLINFHSTGKSSELPAPGKGGQGAVAGGGGDLCCGRHHTGGRKTLDTTNRKVSVVHDVIALLVFLFFYVF